MKRSKILNLNWTDLGKGLLIAFLTALLGGLLTSLQSGEIPVTWVAFQPILEASLAAGVSYLLKNLFTNSEGQLARGERAAAEVRAKRAGGTLKTIILLAILLPMGLGANAQSFIGDVTPEMIAKKQAVRERSTDTIAYNGQHAYFLRGGLTATYKKLYYSTTEKKILGDDYARPGIGLEFAKYTVVDGAAVSDIGFGGYLMIPVKDAQNYISILATVQIYDLARKFKLDFLPPGLSLGCGPCYDFNNAIPVIERFGFIPTIAIKF